MNLLNVFQHKVFPVSFVINEKKTAVMKILSIYFGHHSLAFLDSFLNILNKYNILVFNFKYNLEYVICLFIKLFLECFGGQGPTRSGSRVEEHKHTIFIYIIDKGLVIVKLHKLQHSYRNSIMTMRFMWI